MSPPAASTIFLLDPLLVLPTVHTSSPPPQLPILPRFQGPRPQMHADRQISNHLPVAKTTATFLNECARNIFIFSEQP